METDTGFGRTAWRTGGAVLGVLLLGCVGTYLYFDRPDPVTEGRSAPSIRTEPGPLRSSVLRVPITYDLRGVAEELETRIPEEFGRISENQVSPARPHLRYTFEARRGPLRLEVETDTLELITEIHYRGELTYLTALGPVATSSCGEQGPGGARPAAQVRFASPIDIGDDWNFQSSLELQALIPAGEERCTLSVFGVSIDATPLILRALETRIREAVSEIAAEWRDRSFRSRIQLFWDRLQGAHRIEGEDLWFTLGPRRVGYGGFAAREREEDPKLVRARIQLGVRPRMWFGAEPEADAAALPPLERVRSVGDPSGPDSIRVAGSAGYERLSERANQVVRNRELEAMGQVFRVRDLTVRGLERGRLVVRGELQGDLTGTFVAVGTPVLDADRGRVSVPDLDFALESGGFLTRIGAWVLRSFFLEEVRARAHWEIGTVLPWGGSSATTRRLTLPLGEGWRLGSRIAPIRLTDLVATDSALVVRGRTAVELELQGSMTGR